MTNTTGFFMGSNDMRKYPRLNSDLIRREIYVRGMSCYKFAENVLGIPHCQLVTMLNRGTCSAFYADCLAKGLGLSIRDILLDEDPKSDVPQMEVVLDQGAVMPARAHEYDAGLDLFAREDFVLPPCSRVTHDTGVHLAIPKNHVGFITSKSGLMSKNGITSRGTIDFGYTGSIKAVLFNHSRENVYIRRGQKITQLVVVPCLFPELVQVDSLEESERGEGGFGSSGDF